MYSKIFLIVLFTSMVFMQGCNTIEGAQKGFKEDWKALSKTDEWIKENMW